MKSGNVLHLDEEQLHLNAARYLISLNNLI